MYKKPSLLNIYKRLHNHFGHQGWWPVTKDGSGEHIPQYFPNQPNRKLTPQEKFEICAGAVLTQNTAWSNVVKALAALNKRKLTKPEQIVAIPISKLYSMLRPTGYFRQKAKRLRHFCRHILSNYHGNIEGVLQKHLNEARSELLSLDGIGPETADSMLLYAGGKPVFVVDAYTRRATKRIGILNTDDYDDVQKYFMSNLPNESILFNDFHAQWVTLGKEFCRAAPRCPGCPLKSICRYGKTQ